MSVSRFHPIVINSGQLLYNTLINKRYEQHTTTRRKGNNTVKNRMKAAENHQQEDLLLYQPCAINYLNVNNLSLSEVYKNETTKETSPPYITTILTSKSYSEGHIKNRDSSTATTNNELIYKFYVPRYIGVANARITFDHVCSHCPAVGFQIQANAFPSIGVETEGSHESNFIHSTIIKLNQTGEISIEFYVQPMTWHYALLKFANHTDLNSVVSHMRSEAKQNEQVRIKDFSATASVTTANETTTCFHMPFVLKIDYLEPLDKHQESVVKKNTHRNKDTKTTSENYISSNSETTDSSKAWDPKPLWGIEFYPVLRQTYREFFMYDYDLMPDENGTVPAVLNLTAGVPAGFAFNIGEVHDIGGTLSFAISMKHDNKDKRLEISKAISSIPSTSERSEILAEELIGSPNVDLSNKNEQRNGSKKSDIKNLSLGNQTIIVCMNLGVPGKPTWPDKCRYGRRLLPASSIVNNTDINTSTGLIHVPFPESGQWYVTMGLYCHRAETATIIESVKAFIRKYSNKLEDMRHTCACALQLSRYRECVKDPDCFSDMDEAETLKIKDCLMDSKCTSGHLAMTQKFEVHQKLAREQHFALDNCSTSLIFTISSSPCVAGRCGRYGRCYHYMSGGFVFSTCVCMKGYRGWDCTEDSQVHSSTSILMASLLLTFSNLLFVPSIYIAGRREFYTEAVVYFFAMFFSVFYHACDSGEDEYSFCLVKIGVLQFCDFYCALLAIWVTLVAMSHIRQKFVSLLHMLGAILLAFGTEQNKQSLWVFLAPALIGTCLILSSWGMRCYKSQKWFPARKYLAVYMPLGAVFAMVGLTCYALIQTKQNYHITHSVWHMVMALSIVCLLPSQKSFIPNC